MAGRLVTIATFDQAAEAHIARNALEAANIPVALNNEESSALFGQVLMALGGIRLVVREEDEPAAVKILDDTFGTQEPVDEADLITQSEATEPEDAVEQTLGSAAEPTTDSAREKDARLAFQAAAIGIVFPIATTFALVMIRRASSGPGELSPRGRWNLRAAIVLARWPLLLLGLTALTLLVVALLTLLSPLLG